MSLHAHDEVLKLTRELQADPGSLDGLAVCDAGDLRRLRGMVGDALHDAHSPAFQRAASASALLPTALTAKLAQTIIGPYLAARIAAEMPADRSVKLAGHLDVEFLADVCLSLDPARVADTVRGMADDQVLDVGMLLLEREEFVTLGKFVDVVSPSVLDDMAARITDPVALLRIATSIEARHRLDDLVRRISDDRIAAMIEVAVARGEVARMLTLLTDLGPDNRARLATMAAEAGPEVIEQAVHTALAEDAWGDLLPVLVDLDDQHLAVAADALRRVPDDQQREIADRVVDDPTVDVDQLLGLLDRVPSAADLPVVAHLRARREG